MSPAALLTGLQQQISSLAGRGVVNDTLFYSALALVVEAGSSSTVQQSSAQCDDVLNLLQVLTSSSSTMNTETARTLVSAMSDLSAGGAMTPTQANLVANLVYAVLNKTSEVTEALAQEALEAISGAADGKLDART
jgi:hypothetical protein